MLEQLVEVRAIVGDDDELRDPLSLTVVALHLRQSLAATSRAVLERDALISGI